VFEGPFAYALLAGMVATVNPCGFALLPAYLAAFVGLDDAAGQRGWLSRWGAVGRAVAVAAVLTAGFVTVFGLFGAVISKVIDDAERQLPWVTVVIGLGMVALGVWLLLGRALTLALPRLQRGGADGTYVSMYLFGLSYALASLTCTVGTFLTATTVAFRAGSYPSTVAVFVVYGLGMGVIVGVLTVAVALAKASLVARVRALVPTVSRIAGGLLVLAGAYVAYYGWYSERVLDGYSGKDPIVSAAMSIQRRLHGLLPSQDTAVWWAVAAGLALLAYGVWGWLRRPRVSGTPTGTVPGS
jgi:cytochrome c-type biogenesis protein